MSGLANKAIVITGAGRGIGAACARAAAGLGASVIVNDLDRDLVETVAAEITRSGGRAIAHACDISDWSQAAGLIARCVDEFKKIDGLVNNAGLYQLAKVEDTDEAMWRRITEVNVLGSAFCLVHAVRAMKKSGKGSIVNMSSSSHHGMLDMAPYGASKGAVASMTYCVALEFENTGIRVNAVSPRGATRMAERGVAHAIASGRQPRGGWDRQPPEQNAPAVCYLLSDESAHLNGQMVRVDGNTLSLVGHPTVITPGVRRDAWTFEDVCAAFRTELKPAIQPMGVVYGTITRVPDPEDA